MTDYADDTDDVNVLKVKLADAEATIIRAQQALGPRHEVWWLLDDYDGTLDPLKKVLTAVLNHGQVYLKYSTVAELVDELYPRGSQ